MGGALGRGLVAWGLVWCLAGVTARAAEGGADGAVDSAPAAMASDEAAEPPPSTEPRWLREGSSLMESDDELVFERGGASWYGLGLHRRRTASGERFDMNAFTAAHRTLPFGTRVCVLSLLTGKEIQVRINDRGPHAPGRIIDLSRAAAQALGLLDTGIKEVALSLPALTGRACGSPAD